MIVVNLIPTYNERENITDMLNVLDDLAHKNPKYKFITLVVDDNSPDGTASVVTKFRPRFSKVVLLSGPKKGLGAAMIRGLIYAIRNLRSDIVIANEADFAFDPAHIPFMLQKISEGADVVVGSRHVGGGGTIGWTLTRRLNHWVANTFFASLIAGVAEVNDHNGAFRAVRVKGVLDKLDFTKFPTGFGFFFYWIYALTRVTEKICEFPITYKFRVKGESKISFNPKYIKTYIRDICEYIALAFKIRAEKGMMNQ